MSRSPNFYYQPAPVQQIGSDIARAIFGDPAAAAKQQQAQAEMDARRAAAEEARAHGALYTSQTTGQDTANTAQTGLPGMVADWVRASGPPPPPTPLSSPAFANFDQPLPEDAPRPDAGSALAALIGGIGQMQGDKIDPTKTMGSLAALIPGGDDAMRRSALIAQGVNPSKDFASTPQRADQIAATSQASELAKAMGVAQINNRDNIAVANVNHANDLPVAYANHSNDIPVANIQAGASRDVAGIREAGAAPGFDAIQRVFPNAQMTSGLRSPDHNHEVGGVADSYHLGQVPGVQAYDMPVQPGVSIQEAKLRIEAANPHIKVIEARDETGRAGPNGKALGGWHFTLQNVGGKDEKPPKAIAPAVHKAIREQFEQSFPGFAPTDGDGNEGTPTFGTPKARAYLMSLAEKAYQKTGTISGAVQQAISENGAEAKARRNAASAASKPRPGDVRKGYKFKGGDPANPASWAKVS